MIDAILTNCAAHAAFFSTAVLVQFMRSDQHKVKQADRGLGLLFEENFDFLCLINVSIIFVSITTS